MTRGSRAEASRAAARRSVCALARMASDIVEAAHLHTPEIRTWLASWTGERVGDHPTTEHATLDRLLYALLDARRDVWRHVTHESWQRAHVLRCAAALLTSRGYTGAERWVEQSYQRHLATMQLTEIAARGGVR